MREGCVKVYRWQMKDAVIVYELFTRLVLDSARKFLGNMNCMVLPSSMYSLVVHLLKGDVR